MEQLLLWPAQLEPVEGFLCLQKATPPEAALTAGEFLKRPELSCFVANHLKMPKRFWGLNWAILEYVKFFLDFSVPEKGIFWCF